MSTVLAAARAELATLPGAIASAYFLTDGLNEGEERAVLVDEIARCQGGFQCDCRGVGTDWTPAELRLISNALLGTSDAGADPAGLDADFRAALAKALTKDTGDVRLDLWQPGTSRLVSLRQMQPEGSRQGCGSGTRNGRHADRAPQPGAVMPVPSAPFPVVPRAELAMTYDCPKGHASSDADYCSECGIKIQGSSAPAAGAPAEALSLCPSCATPRLPGARFCEVCRFDFTDPTSTSTSLTAMSAPGREPDTPRPPAFTRLAPVAPAATPPAFAEDTDAPSTARMPGGGPTGPRFSTSMPMRSRNGSGCRGPTWSSMPEP